MFKKDDLSAGLLCSLLVFILLSVTGRDALGASRHITYLQVEANEGNSSGGHTAIRFDKDTFHFQHETSGVIRIKRLDSKSFDHVYAVLGNRSIGESWIEVSDETYNLLLDGFNQFLIIQDEQMNILDSLRQDVTLFEFLLAQAQKRNSQATPSSLPFKGLGYFLPDGLLLPGYALEDQSAADMDNSPSPPVLRSLRSRVKNAYGQGFIEQRIVLAISALRTIRLQAVKLPLSGLLPDLYPAPVISASASYDDALMALFALKLLQTGPNLLPGSYWSNAGAVFQLAPDERIFLQRFAEKLESDLLRLVNSSRSDWGFPFIVGMARLASIEASLASGRLSFLDLYPDVAFVKKPDPFSGRRYLPAMKKEAEEFFLAKRKEFFSGEEMREADFAALELLGNGLMELERSLEYGVQPRSLPDPPFPSRQVRFKELLLPDMGESDLELELVSARSAEKEYFDAVSTLYRYDILRRNCVTEIFTFINKSLEKISSGRKQSLKSENAGSPESLKDESIQRLGGYVDATKGLTFIPAVSAAEVDACYSVTAKIEQPSYRATRLAGMKKTESSLLVFLRESNTITSTIYQRPANDSPFLFFTDDTILLRPLFGAVNLLVGVGESLLGLLTMPVEGPNRLYLGAKGVLFSLPELVFVNLRKGTMEYVAEIR